MARPATYRRALPTLRDRRRRLDPSAKAVASVAGIGAVFLRTLERGETTCSPAVQARLAEVLESDVDELFAPTERSDWVGVNEASRETGIHRKTIRKAIRIGELPAEPPKQHTDAWKIRRADLGAWAAVLDARRAPVRDRLLAELAACGCPGCDNRECEVAHGRCHRDSCEQEAAIATETSARQRAVEGMPTLFCSGRCSLLALEEHPLTRLSREFREWLEREGLVDVEEAARLLDRSRAVVQRFALIHELGQRFPGFHWEGAWAFSKDDLEQLGQTIAATPRGELHREPRRRARWYERRFDSTRMWGRLGGRRRAYSDERAAEVVALKAANPKLGERPIAARLGLSKRQVHEILTRHEVVRNPL